MNFWEAYKSGKPFKRKQNNLWITKESMSHIFHQETIDAEDWEIKKEVKQICIDGYICVSNSDPNYFFGEFTKHKDVVSAPNNGFISKAILRYEVEE